MNREACLSLAARVTTNIERAYAILAPLEHGPLHRHESEPGVVALRTALNVARELEVELRDG